MICSMNSAIRVTFHFMQVAAKKHGWQCVNKHDAACTNSKGNLKTFLTHNNIAGMRQEGFYLSFAICAGFVVLGDALPPVAGPASINGLKAYK